MSTAASAPPMRAGEMRREYIYPHRSVRAFPVSRLRAAAAIVLAASLTAGVARFAGPLLDLHHRITSLTIKIAGIPAGETTAVRVFSYPGAVPAVSVPIPRHGDNPWRAPVLFFATLAALALVHRLVPLARSFILFLSVLLGAAGLVIIVHPMFAFDAATYQKIWLQGEFLVWLLLPWVSAFLFVLTLPAFFHGVAWMLAVQAYALFWSAVRLAFCLGVFHITGILYVALLWFCLGVLFDLVYLLAFYALALGLSLPRAVGRRRS